MANQEMFDYLLEIGCCTTCCLRYLKARGDEYEDIDKTLEKRGVKNTAKNAETVDGSEPLTKKSKSNVCVACLGFFSTEFLDSLIEKLSSHPDLQKYESKEYVLAITLPIILNVRQLSIWLSLMDKFGNTPSCNPDKQPDVPLKEASKLVLTPKLSKFLGMLYGQNGLMLNIRLSHTEDQTELEQVKNVDKLLFKPHYIPKRKRKKTKIADHGITRAYLEKNFQPSNIDVKIYKEHIKVPPQILITSLDVEELSVTGPTIFVAGRYQKFSRELSHSPWILNGKRMMESSIQELITQSVAPYFQVPMEKIIFSSSGREDVDVRCIGRGRPFVLEIPDAKRISMPQSVAEKIELEIEKTKKVNVVNLQIVPRDELYHIKTGEEKKKKTYRALCILEEDATLELVKKLNFPEGLELKQKTPIRVLHRRPNLERTRMVYSVKTFVDELDYKLLVCEIVSQAGTYIKELVHGDLGRTVPSFREVIGQEIDIVALDVIDIDLDWPKAINNRISAETESSIQKVESSSQITSKMVDEKDPNECDKESSLIETDCCHVKDDIVKAAESPQETAMVTECGENSIAMETSSNI